MHGSNNQATYLYHKKEHKKEIKEYETKKPRTINAKIKILKKVKTKMTTKKETLNDSLILVKCGAISEKSFAELLQGNVNYPYGAPKDES